MSRLKKNHVANFETSDYNENANGNENQGITSPNGIQMSIIFPDFDEKIVNKNKFKNETYNENISREWEFEKPVDNNEWSLRSGKLKRLKKK